MTIEPGALNMKLNRSTGNLEDSDASDVYIYVLIMSFISIIRLQFDHFYTKLTIKRRDRT